MGLIGIRSGAYIREPLCSKIYGTIFEERVPASLLFFQNEALSVLFQFFTSYIKQRKGMVHSENISVWSFLGKPILKRRRSGKVLRQILCLIYENEGKKGTKKEQIFPLPNRSFFVPLKFSGNRSCFVPSRKKTHSKMKAFFDFLAQN